MFRFAQPQWLHALWLLPAMVAAWWWQQQRGRRRMSKFADPGMAEKLGSGNSRGKILTGRMLQLAAGLFVVLAASHPQLALKQASASLRGIDVFLIVDVSRSMMATDIKPDRMARAKRALQHLADRLSQHRLGLVAFAGVPFISCPLTRDRAALRLVIDALGPELLPVQGTDLAAAVELATESLARTGAKHSAFVIVSDGENFGNSPLAKVAQAADQGVRTFCLGVGTPQGWMLPGRSDPKTRKPAISRLDEKALKHMAMTGHGTYELLTSGGQEEAGIVAAINKLEKMALLSEEFQTWKDYYPAPALCAALLLLADLLLGRRKGWPAIRARRAGVVLLLLACGCWAERASAASLVDQGLRAFKRRQYTQAEKDFGEAGKQHPDDPLVNYNLGCSLLAQYRYAEAYRAFQRAQPRALRELLRDCYYNLGYTAFYMGVKQGTGETWQEAAEHYIQGLLLDPQDDDARYNLELILRELKRQTQPSARRQEQSQGQDGKDPGGGAPQPGPDRSNVSGRRNDQAKPGEEEKPKTRRQDEGQQATNSDRRQGNKQKGMSPEDALRTLKSLESEESSLRRDAPPGSAEVQDYKGPDW